MLGTERKSLIMSEEDKRETAYHEAGHALVAMLSDDCDPVHKVTIIPRGMAASAVNQVTDRANKMGQNGWELVTSAGSSGETVWCFKRPLWKK